MKKILPIISLIGASALIVGCTNSMETKKEAFIGNINEFKEDFKDYSNLNEKNLTKTAFNKYNLTVVSENLQDLNKLEDSIQTTKNPQNVTDLSHNTKSNEEYETPSTNLETELNEQNKLENTNSLIENEPDGNIEDSSSTPSTPKDNTETENEKDEKLKNISTLYSLSNDIADSCDDFCELKEDLTEAIIETQNLIDKINQKELELTKEQRMFITEQSMQLKNLGRQLSNITTELSFHLSDLNQLMLTNSDNIDNLNLKYLVVLDNLINGNEMLQSSLGSINLINQMFNTSETLPPNNQGRILYGFQHNNNPPVVKDYYIDENGELVENKLNTQNEQNTIENDTVGVEKKTNIDTYQERALNTNIDTYQTKNTPHNIDSFFNTALLDNEFMYGNGGYSNGAINMYGPNNPYLYNYANYERNNTAYGDNNTDITQQTENNDQVNSNQNEPKQEKKRKKLKKNIDTYKDPGEPDIRTKIANIKNSISGFFQKFKKSDLDDKIGNPVYRYDATENNQ